MTLEYKINIERDAQEVAALIATGLGKRMPSEVETAFRNSSVRCYVLDKDRLVGVGRAVSDGVFYAIIFDVVVHPEYQSRGVGTEIMKQLVTTAKTKRVLLYAAPGKEPFYRKLGFKKMLTAMAIVDSLAWYQAAGYLEKDEEPNQTTADNSGAAPRRL